jgi:hypothetical protein
MSNLDHLFHHIKQILAQVLAEKRRQPRRRKRGQPLHDEAAAQTALMLLLSTLKVGPWQNSIAASPPTETPTGAAYWWCRTTGFRPTPPWWRAAIILTWKPGMGAAPLSPLACPLLC